MLATFFDHLFDHLWQSTLFAAAAGLLTLALRNNSARARHALWFAASCKFLVPFSVLIALGSQIEFRRAAQPTPKLAIAIDEVTQPFTLPLSSPYLASVPPAASPLPAILFGIWASGFIGISCSWFARWRRICSVVRAALSLQLSLPIEAKSSTAPIEPGIFGIFRPVLLLPEGISERLTPAQLEAVIAHELCHVRHRDNLIAAIHMFVETLFWFHPLVWWIGKRMVAERERACDEEVLRGLAQPKAYAEGILNICKLYVESPLECVSGVTGGSNLKQRIAAIMSNRAVLKLNLGKKLLLAAAGTLAACAPFIVGLMNGGLARAQSQAPLSFEVASVKPYQPPAGMIVAGTGGSIRVTGNRVNMLGNLLGFVMSAYDVREFQVSGAPHWTDKAGRQQDYVIEAKAEGDADLTRDNARRMLQTLLADRFQLKLHRESKEMPVYDLVVGKNGPKFKEHVGVTPPIEPPTLSSTFAKLKYVNRSMADLVRLVTLEVDRPVLDKTGLTGGYDFTLEYTRTNRDLTSIDSPDADKSIFSAVQEQLGLKLNPAKEPVDILVIDHAEKPSEN